MAIFSFDNSNSGGGGPFNMFYGETTADGQPVYVSRTFDDYKVPPAGHYRLRLAGFAEPKEVPIAEMYRRVDGPTTKMETKLEIEITEGQGKGFRFIVSFVTFSLGDRANAFNLYVATMCNGNKKDAPAVRDWDPMIDKEFMGTVTTPKLNDDGTPKYAQLAWDSLSPVAAEGTGYNPFVKSDAA